LIVDNINNIYQYENIHKYFKKAFQFLKENDLKNLPVGRFEIDGDNVFANIQAYNTNPWENTNWETHAKYIDIQYIVEGKEKIGWCDAKNLTVKENRLATNDVIFYNNDYETITVSVLSSGEFAIYFPTDAHRPGGYYQQPSSVKKVVIKVKC
jgi:YhcH/YjgK/YiaL family protein